MPPSEKIERRIEVERIPRHFRFWVILFSIVLLTACALAIWGKPGFTLSAFSDLTETGCLLVAAVFMIRNAYTNRGSSRVFWLFSAAGIVFWIAGVAQWTAYEVFLRLPAPQTPVGDTILFLKLVPLVAALAAEPQTERTGQLRIFGFLDLSFLLIYIFYFYAIWVIPYRYVVHDEALYSFHFNVVDSIGHILFLIVLGAATLRALGTWRTLYRLYWAAFALYTLSSTIANVAIDEGKYYSGGWYDLPLLISVALLACFAILGGELSSRSVPSALPAHASRSSRTLILLPARIAMLATLSTPLIGFALMSSAGFTDRIGHFRIFTTLLAMLFLTLLLSLKQGLLGSDLMRSLRNSSLAHAALASSSERLLQTERLASLGQVVARVANEVKKAMEITIQSSSALLANAPAGSPTRSMTGKIRLQADRTGSLVNNMLSFACESPLEIAPVDLRQLLSSAIGLTRAARKPRLQLEFNSQEAVPDVPADANRMLQVFLQIIGNAIDATEEASSSSLVITLQVARQHVEIEFADNGPGLLEPERVFDPFYTTKAVGKGIGLGLSTCYGIVRQHNGEISCRNRTGGGAIFTVSLLIDSEVPAAIGVADFAPVEGS